MFLVVCLRNYCLTHAYKDFSPMISFNRLIVLGFTFESLIHLASSFVCGVWWVGGWLRASSTAVLRFRFFSCSQPEFAVYYGSLNPSDVWEAFILFYIFSLLIFSVFFFRPPGCNVFTHRCLLALPGDVGPYKQLTTSRYCALSNALLN